MRRGGSTCLIQDIIHTVIHMLLCVNSYTVVVLVQSGVVLQEKVFEGHGVLLLVGHHQLVVEAEQDELMRKQDNFLHFSRFVH